MSNHGSPSTVAVVGGGFSGVMVVANIVRRRRTGGAPLAVVLFEASGTPARGAAYGTTDDRHLLNVPAVRMGAWPGQAGDFLEWLNAHGEPTAAGAFVPRTRYAAYLADIWSGALNGAVAANVSIEVRATSATGIAPDDGSLIVTSRGREPLRCGAVALCTGHLEPDPPGVRRAASGSRVISNPWKPGAMEAVGVDEHVAILGTGLTMLDVLLTLVGRGHTGPITAISRHGRLPRAHRADPLSPAPVLDVPPSTEALASPRAALRWVRDRVRALSADAGDSGHWTHAIDALRPHTRSTWQRWSVAHREQFVRHLRSVWDVHRHRVDPALIGRTEMLRRDGQLGVRAGRVRSWNEDPGGVEIRVATPGTGASENVRADRLIVCTGPNPDISRTSDPLLRSLLELGLVIRDELGLGAVCEPAGSCVLKSVGGQRHHLFCVGPLRRADWWESIAVPELRDQADEVAAACLRACEPSAS